ncbi:MAG: PAS domain S-box protein [Actinomycetota bacterium]|nr:PAS domain S-box protein [Actinomycetota bacterium]
MEAGAVTRSLSLPPEPHSAGRARRFLAELLVEMGRADWLESALLAVSEVVTNSVLHARTSLTVTASVDQQRLLVEVRDESPALPSERHYDATATTGRGMTLIQSVTDSYGVSHHPRGKGVWFVIGDGTGPADDPEDQRPADPAGRMVALEGMPPSLWLVAREQHDALLRELALVQGVPEDQRLADTDRARRLISETLDRRLAELPEPAGAGFLEVLPTVDLTFEVPAGTEHSFGVMQDVLDEAERLAREGLLLARAGLPEVIALRDWACEQVIAQLAGSPPRRWPGTDAERFAREVQKVGTRAWDADLVRASKTSVVAADEANRIIAVSASLAALLGWRPDDLVGRRVIVLVPPRFREAHVAGFTRHLVTGATRVMGTEVTLPVLRADGTEITCTLLIEQVATAEGRHVYVSWISPLPPPAA